MPSNIELVDQPTRFVGRETELSEINQLLENTDCRLLTLVGVGGIGKTRLAIQVAKNLHTTFVDGVWFVNLQALQSGAQMVSTALDTMGVLLTGHDTLENQLLHYLQEKKILLLLDSFEHVLDGVGFLTQIIQYAPQVKLLVTSRETLSLPGEWIYPLEGLPIPQSHQADNIETNPAVALFYERACRVHPNFTLANNRTSVVRICQLVDGLPLAIEIAASWITMLQCSEITAEIQRNINFLTSNIRHVPERHRSIQAVFSQTWEHLPDGEQALLKKLAVFKGGFRVEAAESIAEVSLPLLSSLRDKCLLHRDAGGRYYINKLMRQYAIAMLDDSELEELTKVICHYYCDFLTQRNLGTMDHEYVTFSSEIEDELENIRIAWQAAVQNKYVDVLKKAAAPYFYFCQIQSRYLEYAEASGLAVNALEEVGDLRALAQILVYQGWMLIRTGQLAQAASRLERSLVLFEEMKLLPDFGMGSHPIAPLIILNVIQGDFTKAVALGEKLKADSAASGDSHNLSFACYGLTSAYLNQEQYEAALKNADEALKLVDDIGNHLFGAYCHLELGNVHRAMGHYTEAENHYRKSLSLKKEYTDPESAALTAKHLGELSLLRQDYQAAQQLYEQSLTIYQRLNDKAGLAATHQSLGQVACQAGTFGVAAQHFRKALDRASEMNSIPLQLSLLIDIGALMIENKMINRGVELLRLVYDHTASHQQQREKAVSFLDGISIIEDANVLDLDTTIITLSSELINFVPVSQAIKQSPLIEPLTTRELDVLHLLGQGLSNAVIAEQLYVSVGTVKAHTHRIYGKLGVTNRVEAVIKAQELSLLNNIS